MEIIAKRTDQLTEKEIDDIYALFAEVFGKVRTSEEFHKQFENTSRGYSYHAIAIEEGRVIGHNVYIPFTYLKESESFLLCLSVDAMIHPLWQGKGLYRKLLSECEKLAIKDGCVLRIGFPNDSSYPIQVKGFGYNDVGRLSTYILPINLGQLFPKFKLLNVLSRIIGKLLTDLALLSRSQKLRTYKYRKDRSSFDAIRYKWFGGNYEVRNNGKVKWIYKEADFKGYTATFILDVWPMTKKNFDTAVREIYKEKKDITPAIIYVGNLPFRPLSMLTIPKYFEPKHFHFVSKILNSNVIGQDSLEISNWELNLSNYDLL